VSGTQVKLFMYMALTKEMLFHLSYFVIRANIRCDNTDCQQQYNMSMIEQQLVQMMTRRSMSYTLQDLKCVKCKMVSRSKMFH